MFPPPQGDPAGVAVVIDSDRAPAAKLPSVGEVEAHPARVAQGFRGAGLRVQVDPTGRCLAVTAPVHVTDMAILGGNLSDAALVAGILERLTPQQLAARKKGYLPADVLPAVPLAAARAVATRRGLLDKQGRPRDEGAALHIGLWQTWELHVSTSEDGKPVCQRLDYNIRPPTAAAIPAAPLPGSVLWWAWPYAEAVWGDKSVSLPPGTYTLGDLANRLSQAGGVSIAAHPNVRYARFAVVARQIPLRTLLWAISAASGLSVRLSTAPDTAGILLTSEMSREEMYHQEFSVLRPIPGLGYYSASDSAIGRELLSRLEGGPADDQATWVGWRLRDLPLLYRTSIEQEWERTHKVFHQRASRALDPEHTFVLWTKAVLVSVVLMRLDGSGGGSEFPLPAF